MSREAAHHRQAAQRLSNPATFLNAAKYNRKAIALEGDCESMRSQQVLAAYLHIHYCMQPAIPFGKANEENEVCMFVSAIEYEEPNAGFGHASGACRTP